LAALIGLDVEAKVRELISQKPKSSKTENATKGKRGMKENSKNKLSTVDYSREVGDLIDLVGIQQEKKKNQKTLKTSPNEISDVENMISKLAPLEVAPLSVQNYEPQSSCVNLFEKYEVSPLLYYKCDDLLSSHYPIDQFGF
jgi:hypothetical protein